MLYVSKAQEISKMEALLTQNVIGKEEFQEQLAYLLGSSYMPVEAGVSEDEEIKLLWALAQREVIGRSDYDDQVSKIKRAAVCGFEKTNPVPHLKRKKGYVAPIVLLAAGVAFICFGWLILGIIITLFALLSLSGRVRRNKKTEVKNAQTILQYRANYS